MLSGPEDLVTPAIRSKNVRLPYWSHIGAKRHISGGGTATGSCTHYPHEHRRPPHSVAGIEAETHRGVVSIPGRVTGPALETKHARLG